MFGFFQKADVPVDEGKVNVFVAWFAENEEAIRKSVENMATDRHTMLTMLDEVEAQLAKVYRDGYRGRIEFDYGGQGETWELNLYHKNKKFLMDATGKLAAALESAEIPYWRINIAR